jgi:hypothetical protein
MSNFTSDEWKIHENLSDGRISIQAFNDEKCTLSIEVRSAPDELHANLQLIAAAPDLLEVLQWARISKDTPELREAMDAAINKALGDY